MKILLVEDIYNNFSGFCRRVDEILVHRAIFHVYFEHSVFTIFIEFKCCLEPWRESVSKAV